MNDSSQHFDQLLDAGLRAVGPQLPEPRVSPAGRAKVAALLEMDGALLRRVAHPKSTWPRGIRRVTPFLTLGLAAAALWMAFLLLNVRRENHDLQREVDRLTEVLLGELTPYPGGPFGPDDRFVVVNLHSDLCPRAKAVTPEFNKLASRHAGDPIRFVTIDVQCNQAQSLTQMLNLDCIFDKACCGSETGTIKVVDRAGGNVLLTAVGTAELDRVEKLISERCSGCEKVTAPDRDRFQK